MTVTEHGENVRDSAAIGLSVAGSVASVLCRHIISAANQNRGTQFIISLPLPVSLSKTSLEADIHFTELRRMFNATVKANCSSCSNIQCCDNENLSGSTKLSKYLIVIISKIYNILSWTIPISYYLIHFMAVH